jgi:hypothetical protein
VGFGGRYELVGLRLFSADVLRHGWLLSWLLCWLGFVQVGL